MNAKKLGWDKFFEDQLKTSDLSLIRARVSRQNTDHCMLLSEIGELTGILPGKFKGKEKGDWPTIGDWVLARKPEHLERSKVLIDRVEGDYFIGRSEYDSPEVDNEVLIKKDESTYCRIGDFVEVEIVKADHYDLYANLI